MDIHVSLDEEKRLLEKLETRSDTEAKRMREYLAMPDLSRTPGSPLFDIVERVKQVPGLAGFDIIKIPEIVPTELMFDLFDFSADHPARSKSDTYYADETNVLRPHDTVFWYYYLRSVTEKCTGRTR
jgi:phenylalanyl-tRNA synthetase alpha chain